MSTWTTIEPAGHAAYLAQPQSGSGPGVLVLHAWWGLTADITNMCDRLAREGFVALAPSLYPDQKTASTLPEAEEMIEEHDSDPDLARSVALAAARQLQSMTAVASDHLGVVGLSMGAYWALELADMLPDVVAAAVAIYGSSDNGFGKATADVMLHFAESDEYEPSHLQHSLEQTLHNAGLDVTTFTYPGTTHWFAEPAQSAAYNEDAAELLLERTIHFFRSRLG